jgi:transposase, IS605 OrfB family, central region
LESKIAQLSRKQRNIRQTYTRQIVSDLVKTHPRAIVMESLNVKGMLRNGKLARSIQEQTWGLFLGQMSWKCLQDSTEFRQVSQFYPSSKTCNACGYMYKDLKLSDRVFNCPCCGYTKDRDSNAADNLRDYGKLLLTTA